MDQEGYTSMSMAFGLGLDSTVYSIGYGYGYGWLAATEELTWDWNYYWVAICYSYLGGMSEEQ